MKAKITIPNIKGFIQGNFRKLLDDFQFLPKHIKEQAMWRLNEVKKKSPDCLKEDSCLICECQVTAKVFEDRACEGICYGPMLNEEEWNKFYLTQQPIKKW